MRTLNIRTALIVFVFLQSIASAVTPAWTTKKLKSAYFMNSPSTNNYGLYVQSNETPVSEYSFKFDPNSQVSLQKANAMLSIVLLAIASNKSVNLYVGEGTDPSALLAVGINSP